MSEGVWPDPIDPLVSAEPTGNVTSLPARRDDNDRPGGVA